jgi:hypothetical protein
LIKGLGTGTSHDVRVQYYSVVCPLGHRVRGQRTEGYQALRCPACGEGVFVLPLSPLPEPVAPARSARSRPAAAARPVDEGPLELKEPGQVTVDMEQPDDLSAQAEIIWDEEIEEANQTEESVAAEREEPRPAAESVPPRRKPKAASARRAPGGEMSSAEVSEPAQPALRRRPRREESRALPVEAVEPRARPARRLTWHSPQVIVAGVFLLVLSTVVLGTWRSYRRDLPQVALAGFTEGIPALKAGRFDKAYQLLSPAKDAVVALHDQVEHAGEIREAADQAAIFVNLLSDSLESLLDEAARSTPQDWSAQFDTLYKGRSVVIDATITATPETSPNHCYEIDYLVLTQGDGDPRERKAVIDLTGVEAITLAHRSKGDHVTIGACLESFQFDVDAGVWVIRLDPKSAVSVTCREALESLGWPSGAILPDESLPAGGAP